MSTTENAVIRRAIAEKMRTVPGIGVVYEFERYAKTERDFKTLYGNNEVLLGWHIRRVSRRETLAFNEVECDWEIRGFRSLSDADASELVFDDLVDAVLDAFRDDVRLGGILLTPRDDGDAVPALQDSGPVMFCGVLCHSVRLKFATRSWRAPNAGD